MCGSIIKTHRNNNFSGKQLTEMSVFLLRSEFLGLVLKFNRCLTGQGCGLLFLLDVLSLAVLVTAI